MNILQQLIADVARHQRSLEERLAVLKDEQSKTKKILSQVTRHRERLERDHGNGEATLPLSPPDDDEEEEATDEADDREPRITDGMDGPAEPLVPDEWSPDYEVPEEPDESERAYRSRLDDQAESDKIGANQEPLGKYHREEEAKLHRSFPADLSAKSEADATANALTPEQISAASEKGLSPSEYSECVGLKPIRRRKAKATAEE